MSARTATMRSAMSGSWQTMKTNTTTISINVMFSRCRKFRRRADELTTTRAPSATKGRAAVLTS